MEGQLAELGGQVVTSAVIEPIRNHGLLVDLPPQRVRELIEHPDVTLALLDDIMYLRPQSVAAIAEPDEEGEAAPAGAEAAPVGDPIAALLDGMPVANHQRLVGRLILEDPDDYGARTPAARRSHGTSMASLIVHGDLQGGEQPLARPIYVRPVLVFDAIKNAETTPPERLPLDVVYLAVRRLFEGEGGAPASAPGGVVVNLSLGDLNRPFSGRISPWARLMDWLAFRYRVLFMIDDALGPGGKAWMRHRDNIARFLGYGRPDIDRVFDCAAERATLFTYGDILQDLQDEFDIPLPPSIEGTMDVRRLTMTLAWLTPVNARHRQYRSATLELLPAGGMISTGDRDDLAGLAPNAILPKVIVRGEIGG